MAQGSIGGGLISANNLDNGINEQFKGSADEVAYGPIRVQSMLFQDDIARVCTSRNSAQAGNVKFESTFETKLLDPNTEKSVYIILGEQSQTKHIRNDIEECRSKFDISNEKTCQFR